MNPLTSSSPAARARAASPLLRRLLGCDGLQCRFRQESVRQGAHVRYQLRQWGVLAPKAQPFLHLPQILAMNRIIGLQLNQLVVNTGSFRQSVKNGCRSHRPFRAVLPGTAASFESV